MRNRLILIGYLILFFSVVSLYQAFADNELLVFLATATILITGLIAWVWSVQPERDDE